MFLTSFVLILLTGFDLFITNNLISKHVIVSMFGILTLKFIFMIHKTYWYLRESEGALIEFMYKITMSWLW